MDHFNKIGFLYLFMKWHLLFKFWVCQLIFFAREVKGKEEKNDWWNPDLHSQNFIQPIFWLSYPVQNKQTCISLSFSFPITYTHTHSLALSLSRSLLLPFGQIKWSKYKTALHRKLFCCISKDYFSFAHSSPYSSNVKYSLDVLIIPRAWVFGSSLFRSISALVKIVQLAALIDQTLS